VFCYILIVAAVAFIAMFFASQHSRHLQIGYDLTRLQSERHELQKRARKLDFEIDRAAGREALVQTADGLGLNLVPPTEDQGPD